MGLRTLDQLRGLKEVLTRAHKRWLAWAYGVEVPTSVKLSLSARLRAGRGAKILVGEQTLIAFKTLIDTYDPMTDEHRDIQIGSRCFIGGSAQIAPGVTIGDQCIVGAGSVVFDDVPDNCIVGGNPARILRQSVVLGPFGVLPVAKQNTHRLWDL